MRFLPLILSLAAVSVPVWGQSEPTPQTLTLQEAVRKALESNLTLQRSRVDVTAADLQRRTLLASVLPKVNIQGATTQNSEEVSFGSGSDQRTILPGTDWNYRLILTQPIYAGSRERRALQQARLNVDVARQGVVSAEDQILTGVVADYLSVLEGESLLAVEQRNLELAGNRQKQARDLFEAGETTRVEVLRAESDIKAAERRIAAARQLRDAAESRLRLDLSIDGSVAPIQVSEPGPLFPQLPPETALYTEAERLRPEVSQAQTNVEIARLEVLKQKGALLPVVAAEGGWINQRSTFPSDRYGYFTLRVNVPVYQGGEVKARTAAAQERQRQAEMALEQTRQTVREQVRLALLDLQTSDANLRLAREQLTAAEAEYQQASELYQAQEITALESEAAETSLAEARRAVATGELDRAVAELRVWSAAGLLKQTLLPEDAR
ncbi:MAG TPA: TolC family protein [Thermoanaerobaculia bacterium]|jgi:outer membrane protein|nr:TolC family protein [Thermoanaerobaculia bacterium]